jgi:hypothetical protein
VNSSERELQFKIFSSSSINISLPILETFPLN